MPGMENDVLVAKNVNFNYTANPPHVGVINADAQLLIGSVTSHPTIAMQAGNLVSDGSITITYQDPNIKLVAAGGMTTQTITPDVGVPVNPVAGTIGVKGSVSTLPTDSILTHNFGNPNVGIENRRWLTAFVVDPSATVGSRGTYTTIASAITAATASGGIVVIRPGTYTENFTLPANVDLMGMGGAGNDPLVTIVGKITASDAGSRTISNIRLQTNSDVFLAVTGSAATKVYIDNCYLNITNAHGIDSTTTSTSSEIWVKNCLGNVANTFHVFDIDHGFIEFLSSTILNATSTSTNTAANDSGVFFKYTYFSGPITTSNTASFTMANSYLDNAQNATLTLGGTGNNYIHSSTIDGGTSSAISIGAGALLELMSCNVGSSNTNPITGAGTFKSSGLTLRGTAAINTTTQTFSQFGTYSTWTPTIVGGGSAGTTTYTTQVGQYHRIGNLVWLQGTIVITAATGTGDATLGGLPFTIKNVSSGGPRGTIMLNASGWAWPAGRTQLTLQGLTNNTVCLIVGTGTSVASANLQMTNAAATFSFTLMYEAE